LFRLGLGPTFRGLVRPALFAGLVWWAVAGFWCGPNLVKYHHPFPHPWDLMREMPGQQVVPPLYRRPLGWALPFEWREYWKSPILRDPSEPLPNFWAVEISGTWADFYNRGFCRLRGEEVTHRVWGGLDGFMNQGSEIYSVTLRCVSIFAKLVHVGVWITAASTFAVFFTGWLAFRSRFRLGSLGLPLLVILSVFSGMTFALLYPFDNIAVLNPRYLLPGVTPMCACAAVGLARLESTRRRGGTAGALSSLGLVVAAALLACVTALLLYLRFWTF
jgi:hypothetical protein